MKTITVESQPATIEIEFSLTTEELDWARQHYDEELRAQLALRSPKFVAAGIGSITVGAGLLLAWSISLKDLTEQIGVGLLVMAPVLLVISYWALNRRNQQTLADHKNQNPCKQCWTAGVSGLTVSEQDGSREIPWTSLRRVFRLGDYLALMVNDIQLLLIPDRAFLTPKQQLRFLKLIKSNTGAGVVQSRSKS